MGICCSCDICYTPICGCCGWKGPSNNPTIQHKDWIYQLALSNQKLALRDAVIFGTHDSATGSISPNQCCSALAITTRMSLYEQLSSGARYLDIRLGSTSKDPWDISIFHGPISGGVYCSSVKNENNSIIDPYRFNEGVPSKQ